MSQRKQRRESRKLRILNPLPRVFPVSVESFYKDENGQKQIKKTHFHTRTDHLIVWRIRNKIVTLDKSSKSSRRKVK